MNLLVESSASTRRQAIDHADALIPKWVRSTQEAVRAATSEDSQIVWIVKKPNLVNNVAHQIAVVKAHKRAGYLILLSNPRPALIAALEKRFTAVACVSNVLAKEELQEVWSFPDRRDRFIGGTVDEGSKTVTLWRGNFESIIVPFNALPVTGSGIRPDFKNFSVTEYGQTLKFGEYESDSEAILFEFAPDFRRRLKQTRFAEEQTLGASIRRLRRQKRMTRNEFGDIDPKTIARIEQGKIKNPRISTLQAIAKILGVRRDELGDY
jgi:DNA-binding XRE family transcriptional regulator